MRCVQVLLDYHADVERVSSQRLTALDMAKGNPPCERLLEQVVARAKVPCWTEEGNLIMCEWAKEGEEGHVSKSDPLPKRR